MLFWTCLLLWWWWLYVSAAVTNMCISVVLSQRTAITSSNGMHRLVFYRRGATYLLRGGWLGRLYEVGKETLTITSVFGVSDPVSEPKPEVHTSGAPGSPGDWMWSGGAEIFLGRQYGASCYLPYRPEFWVGFWPFWKFEDPWMRHWTFFIKRKSHIGYFIKLTDFSCFEAYSSIKESSCV